MIVFEYDENKSQSNLAKYGIDFIEAQKLWTDPKLLEIPARTQDEPRFLADSAESRLCHASCRVGMDSRLIEWG